MLDLLTPILLPRFRDGEDDDVTIISSNIVNGVVTTVFQGDPRREVETSLAVATPNAPAHLFDEAVVVTGADIAAEMITAVAMVWPDGVRMTWPDGVVIGWPDAGAASRLVSRITLTGSTYAGTLVPNNLQVDMSTESIESLIYGLLTEQTVAQAPVLGRLYLNEVPDAAVLPHAWYTLAPLTRVNKVIYTTSLTLNIMAAGPDSAIEQAAVVDRLLKTTKVQGDNWNIVSFSLNNRATSIGFEESTVTLTYDIMCARR